MWWVWREAAIACKYLSGVNDVWTQQAACYAPARGSQTNWIVSLMKYLDSDLTYKLSIIHSLAHGPAKSFTPFSGEFTGVRRRILLTVFGSLFWVLQLENGRIDGAWSGRCDVLFSPAILDNLPASAETREAKWLPLSNCHCSHSRKLDWSWPFLISPPLGRLVFSPAQGWIYSAGHNIYSVPCHKPYFSPSVFRPFVFMP